ncbi:MAG TPA: helix-turn-helix domain-containing protein, partial [Vicinamibacteria bacterium]|nr:helix-turn-helix domain-containing protein [Vicinamibacteria bacterium]
MRHADPDHRKQQVAKILSNARRLFARDGYDRVSVDRIAAACGLTKPVLYYYFEN